MNSQAERNYNATRREQLEQERGGRADEEFGNGGERAHRGRGGGGGGRDRKSGLPARARPKKRPKQGRAGVVDLAFWGKVEEGERVAGEGDFALGGGSQRKSAGCGGGEPARVVTFQWAHGHGSRPIHPLRACEAGGGCRAGHAWPPRVFDFHKIRLIASWEPIRF